jgi:prevent-host-death family protein
MRATATEVQNSFGKYLKISVYEKVIITKNGRDLAFLSAYNKQEERKDRINEGSAAYSTGKPFRLSYQDYLKMTGESNNRYEYIHGIIYLLASPVYIHQKIAADIFRSFAEWSADKKCKPYFAPFDVKIELDDEKNVVQPDILVICDHNKIDEKGRYNGTPALVIEIMSDSTKTKDMTVKLDLYARSGIREYWIINPETGKTDIYTFTDGEIDKNFTYKRGEKIISHIFESLWTIIA